MVGGPPRVAFRFGHGTRLPSPIHSCPSKHFSTSLQLICLVCLEIYDFTRMHRQSHGLLGDVSTAWWLRATSLTPSQAICLIERPASYENSGAIKHIR